MALFLLLKWIVFTRFGFTFTLKVEKKFQVQDNFLFEVILTPQYLGWVLLLKKSSLNSFMELKQPHFKVLN